MKAEPIMGEKYRGKKVSRKDLAEDVSKSFNSSFYHYFLLRVMDANSDLELLG
jgi:hypothetical protein